VRRALERAGVLFVVSDRGRGVMLLNEARSASPKGLAQPSLSMDMLNETLSRIDHGFDHAIATA
jgi:hypothetical protein